MTIQIKILIFATLLLDTAWPALCCSYSITASCHSLDNKLNQLNPSKQLCKLFSTSLEDNSRHSLIEEENVLALKVFYFFVFSRTEISLLHHSSVWKLTDLLLQSPQQTEREGVSISRVMPNNWRKQTTNSPDPEKKNAKNRSNELQQTGGLVQANATKKTVPSGLQHAGHHGKWEWWWRWSYYNHMQPLSSIKRC